MEINEVEACPDRIRDDTDSVVSDSCWEETYRGDSHKWIIRDKFLRKIESEPCSTMKTSYMYPKYDDLLLKGKRHLLVEDKLLREVEEEMAEEKRVAQQETCYVSTYDDVHRTPGFVPRKIDYEKNRELYTRFPLYKSQALSYWQSLSDRRQDNGGKTGVGQTTITDVQNPFKRCSYFTRPVEQLLEIAHKPL